MTSAANPLVNIVVAAAAVVAEVGLELVVIAS